MVVTPILGGDPHFWSSEAKVPIWPSVSICTGDVFEYVYVVRARRGARNELRGTRMAPKLKLALVGCGRICEVAHFPGYQQHASHLVEVTACVDINEELDLEKLV